MTLTGILHRICYLASALMERPRIEELLSFGTLPDGAITDRFDAFGWPVQTQATLVRDFERVPSASGRERRLRSFDFGGTTYLVTGGRFLAFGGSIILLARAYVIGDAPETARIHLLAFAIHPEAGTETLYHLTELAPDFATVSAFLEYADSGASDW